MIYFFFLILAGILQGFMISLNGQLGNYYSLFGISFFVHAIALVFLIAYIKLVEKQKITFQGVPKYVYTVGFMGVIIVASSSWCTLQIGATTVLSISVIGQMFSSAIVDHFGFFGVEKVPFRLKQLPCYLLVLAGVLIVVNE